MTRQLINHIKALCGMPQDQWRFWSYVNTSGDCWLWKGTINEANGRGVLRWNGKNHAAHRIAFSVYYNLELSSDQLLLHSCDNPRCVNPEHLSIGTHMDNSNDKMRKGRHRSGGPRLTPEQVENARSRYKSGGVTQLQLSQEYCITPNHMRRILKDWFGWAKRSHPK